MFAVAKIDLQCPRIMALVGEGEAACVPQHVRLCLLKPSLASTPARSTMRAKPAAVKGDPRSDVITKGEMGCCSKVV